MQKQKHNMLEWDAHEKISAIFSCNCIMGWNADYAREVLTENPFSWETFISSAILLLTKP